MNKIIKNEVTLYGDYEKVAEVMKGVQSDRSLIDFNNIEPMDNTETDLDFNDYANKCLNVYIEKHKEIEEDLVRTFTFLGRTRKYPYEFTRLSEKELNVVRSKYQEKQLLDYAECIIKKIEDKSIFNGYLVRHAMWGTGSGALNPRIKDNKIFFEVYDHPPIKIIEKLSQKYPQVKIDYAYNIDGSYTIIEFKNGKEKCLLIENEHYKEPEQFNLIKQNVKI